MEGEARKTRNNKDMDGLLIVKQEEIGSKQEGLYYHERNLLDPTSKVNFADFGTICQANICNSDLF